jgi:voltage-gated potassium channel
MQLRRLSDRARALQSIPLFRDLSRSDLEEVARMSYRVTRDPGLVIIEQEEVGTEMYLIVEGTARVERDGVVIGEAGPNSVIGEMALIDNRRRSATIIAETRCELLAIPYDKFWAFVNTVPSIQRTLLVTLSKRVRDLERPIGG